MPYVLIIDDDEDFASAAAKVLRNGGHEVAIEVSPESAISRMEQRRPDLAILDVMFPESISAGFELARTIYRKRERLRGIPVLMLTAVNARFPFGFGPQDIDKNWLPVSDFLEKPVDIDVLCSRVEELLSSSSQPAAVSGSL